MTENQEDQDQDKQCTDCLRLDTVNIYGKDCCMCKIAQAVIDFYELDWVADEDGWCRLRKTKGEESCGMQSQPS